MQVIADTLAQHTYVDSINALDTIVALSGSPISGETMNSFMSSAGIAGFSMPSPQSSWGFFLIFGLISALILVRIFLGDMLLSIFSASVRYGTAVSMFKDNSQIQRQKDNALDAFYFLSIGLLGSILLEFFNFLPFALSGFQLMLFITAFLLIWYYVRKVLLTVIGHVFYSRDLFKEYIYHSNSYNKLMGLVVLPLNLILLYATGTLKEIMIYSSIIILIVIVIMKTSRALIFSLKHRVLNFYLFLYLCALEIVPFLLIYKWFISIV